MRNLAYLRTSFAVLTMGIFLGACSTGALVGAGAGGVAGAAIGKKSGNTTEGAIIGGAAGAVVGDAVD